MPPNLKPGLDALKAAKEAFKAKFTPGFYHASGANDIEEFIPSHRRAIFATRDPEFAQSFNPIDEKASEALSKGFAYKTGATTYPLSINMGKHFDVDTPEGKKFVEHFLSKQPNYFPHKMENYLGDQSWAAVENKNFMRALKNAGYDTFSIKEGGVKNVGIFDPKNIRGKFAEYNPEHAESADFMKAEGGAINPIKTPQEMLLELANVPHMADGRQVVKAGSELSKLIQDAIQKYIRIYKKNPPPEDIKALEAHVAAITQKPTIWTDPVTQARARHELATNPGMINPEDVRDPFLTQAMTGRGVKGTRQAPFVADINDPNLQKSLETKQMSGRLENLAGAENIPSTTPAADALARMATGLEQQALSSGKVPLIDQLKIDFFKKNKRYPSDEELEVIIAEFNPLRHQYGPAGASIVTSRPPTAKGMSDWRSKARAEGVPEAYLQKPPADYPNYLQAELDIAKGIQPTVRQSSDDLIKNPNREYAGGHGVAPLSPREMEAMIAAQGAKPTRLDRIVQNLGVPFAASSGYMAGESLGQGEYGNAALHGLTATGLGMSAVPKYMKPGLGLAGVASAPMSIEEAVRRYEQGDRTGAVLSAIQAIASAAQASPLAVPAAGVGMGVAVADALRNKPEYRSVMEGYK